LGGLRGCRAYAGITDGGAVLWLLPGEAQMEHIGTADMDLDIDPAALRGVEYARLVEALREHGYLQRDNLRRGLSLPATTDPTVTETASASRWHQSRLFWP